MLVFGVGRIAKAPIRIQGPQYYNTWHLHYRSLKVPSDSLLAQKIIHHGAERDEELHERDAKGSCAMKRLAQLFKRQKLEAMVGDGGGCCSRAEVC